jgi:hypothetical protein
MCKHSHMPPVPPANRSHKGTGDNSETANEKPARSAVAVTTGVEAALQEQLSSEWRLERLARSQPNSGARSITTTTAMGPAITVADPIITVEGHIMAAAIIGLTRVPGGVFQSLRLGSERSKGAPVERGAIMSHDAPTGGSD